MNNKLISVRPDKFVVELICSDGKITEGRFEGKAAVTKGAEADTAVEAIVVVASSGLVRV